MKNYINLLVGTLAFIASCQLSDEYISEEIQSEHSEKWKLVKSISAWSGTVTDHNTVDFKIYYIFKPDGSFIKFTTEGDTVKGTYQKSNLKGVALELNFPEGYNRFSSCTYGKEYFTTSSDTLISDGRPCDKPKLYFLKY